MTGEGMRPGDPMRRSGARWCDDHQRWECSKRTRSGAPCHESAIAGKAVGRMHAGQPGWLVKAQGEANLAAWTTEAAGEAAAPLDTAKVVMDQLRVAVLRADLYGLMLREALEAEQGGALVGSTFAAGRDGARVETGEAVRSLARLEAEWRDRVVRFVKTAHDMGIDARRLELEQAQASIVVTAVGLGLDALALGAEARDVFLRTFLGAIGRPAELDGGDDTARHSDTEETS